MLLVYCLVICLVSLLVFSLSGEKGKNTKHARKGSSIGVQKSQPFRTTGVIKVN